MLSGRELYQENLDPRAKTWVNERLVFTHGYGLALSPVTEVTEEGAPILQVKDIPPVSDFERFRIERPEIYYGEKTDNYNKETDEKNNDKNNDKTDDVVFENELISEKDSDKDNQKNSSKHAESFEGKTQESNSL